VGVAMRGVYAGAVAGPLLGGPLASTAPAGLWLGCAAVAAGSSWAFVRLPASRGGTTAVVRPG
jgi:hypothetical protein